MKTNIKDLPDEKLIELCAEAHGLEKEVIPHPKGGRCAGFRFSSSDWISRHDYNPLAPTQAGKAQAMGLVEKFNVSMHPVVDGWYAECEVTHADAYADDLQRAIVLAVVASKYGDTIEYDGGEV